MMVHTHDPESVLCQFLIAVLKVKVNLKCVLVVDS